MNYFPSVLNVSGRDCLVIGDDHEAIEKTARLKKSGAVVSVVLPSQFQLRQISTQFLVIFCPKDQPLLVKKIYHRCRRQRILLCAIDQPEYCDVVNVSVFERGDLKIMTSTNGVSPTLAKTISKGLADSLESIPVEKNLKKLKQLRQRLFGKKIDPLVRRKKLIAAVAGVRFSARMLWPMSPKGKN